eukprot:5709313-Pleurochrysis_carterae.AAC.1
MLDAVGPRAGEDARGGDDAQAAAGGACLESLCDALDALGAAGAAAVAREACAFRAEMGVAASAGARGAF